MGEKSKPQVSSAEEPLFVLKYRRNHVSIRVFCFVLLALICLIPLIAALLMSIFGSVFSLFMAPLLGLICYGLIREIDDLRCFKEIRLYQDKIVKVWTSMRTREIKLIDAILVTSDHRMKKRWIRDANVKGFLSHYKGIGYYGDLPAADDMKKLHRLLAALSGRRVKELEQYPSIGRLIEEGSSPRPITSYEFDEQDLREEEEEEAFNRVVSRALIVCVLFMTLIPVILIILSVILSHR